MYQVTFIAFEPDYFLEGLSAFYPIIPRIGDSIIIAGKEESFLVKDVTIFPKYPDQKNDTTDAELLVQRLG